MEIAFFENVKYFLDLGIRNVFTRDMRDFSVADQGKWQKKNTGSVQILISFLSRVSDLGVQSGIIQESLKSKTHIQPEVWKMETLIDTQGGFGEGL